MKLMQKFFSFFPREFDMNFYGIDIIVDSETGVHYIVDCNYLSNYGMIEQNELIAALDKLLLGQIAEMDGRDPPTPRGAKSTNFEFRGQQLTPRSVENIALGTLGAITIGLVCSIAYLALRRKQV